MKPEKVEAKGLGKMSSTLLESRKRNKKKYTPLLRDHVCIDLFIQNLIGKASKII